MIVGAYALAFHGAPRASAADFAQPGSVYQIGLPPRRIDLLTEISGVTFDEAWASRTTAELEGRTVAFIGREALIKYKEASGRLKDVADVARLRKTHPTQEGYPASGRTPCAYVGFRLTAFGASDDGELAASRGWPPSG